MKPLAKAFIKSTAALAVAVNLAPLSGQAAIVSTGWDLLYTLPGTEFDLDGPGGMAPVPFRGIPLTTFDFGGAIGVQTIDGLEDTILQRLDPVTFSGEEIDIELVALSLRSVTPIDFTGFGGVANETISTVNPVDTGSKMTVYLNPGGQIPDAWPGDTRQIEGTFDSQLTFSIQLQGDISGALTPAIPLTFTQTNAYWTRDPAPAGVYPDDPTLITDVNLIADPMTTLEAVHEGEHVHITVGGIPEPTVVALLGLGVAAFSCQRRRRR